jgi:hypothetical protein
LLTAAQARGILVASARPPFAGWSGPDRDYGNGVPDAEQAVILALEGAGNVNRKTPLFALRSDAERNYVFTVVPQVAMAAIEGRLPPRPEAQDAHPTPVMSRYVSVGATVSPYNTFRPVCPDVANCTPYAWGVPLASASVLTTPKNPVSRAPDLRPLYRMSWRCSGQGACPGNHVRHFYTTTEAELQAMEVQGFRLDGIEGFVFDASSTAAQRPTGVVRLCRKYNATRDDFILYAGNGVGSSACDIVVGSTGEQITQGTSGTYADWNGSSINFVGFAYPPGFGSAVGPQPSAATKFMQLLPLLIDDD